MNNSTTGWIYRIVCTPTSQVYVGQTTDLERRYGQHFSKLRRNTHSNSLLQEAFNQYGASAFEFEIIESDVPVRRLLARESYWISRHNAFIKGFNMTGCLAPDLDFMGRKTRLRPSYYIREIESSLDDWPTPDEEEFY